jgi:hypothetical protein
MGLMCNEAAVSGNLTHPPPHPRAESKAPSSFSWAQIYLEHTPKFFQGCFQAMYGLHAQWVQIAILPTFLLLCSRTSSRAGAASVSA